jgi:hypothetical protein
VKEEPDDFAIGKYSSDSGFGEGEIVVQQHFGCSREK